MPSVVLATRRARWILKMSQQCHSHSGRQGSTDGPGRICINAPDGFGHQRCINRLWRCYSCALSGLGCHRDTSGTGKICRSALGGPGRQEGRFLEMSQQCSWRFWTPGGTNGSWRFQWCPRRARPQSRHRLTKQMAQKCPPRFCRQGGTNFLNANVQGIILEHFSIIHFQK